MHRPVQRWPRSLSNVEVILQVARREAMAKAWRMEAEVQQAAVAAKRDDDLRAAEAAVLELGTEQAKATRERIEQHGAHDGIRAAAEVMIRLMDRFTVTRCD